MASSSDASSSDNGGHHGEYTRGGEGRRQVLKAEAGGVTGALECGVEKGREWHGDEAKKN